MRYRDLAAISGPSKKAKGRFQYFQRGKYPIRVSVNPKAQTWLNSQEEMIKDVEELFEDHADLRPGFRAFLASGGR